MTMKEYHFETEMEVRDYECDIQGIVNNSVYLNYFEHCRHKFSQNAGLDFTQMHYGGVDAVVIRAELDFKFPLKPGDLFLVRLRISKKGRLRLIFDQQIIRKTDNKLMTDARITVVITKNGKPISTAILDEKLNQVGINLNES